MSDIEYYKYGAALIFVIVVIAVVFALSCGDKKYDSNHVDHWKDGEWQPEDNS